MRMSDGISLAPGRFDPSPNRRGNAGAPSVPSASLSKFVRSVARFQMPMVSAAPEFYTYEQVDGTVAVGVNTDEQSCFESGGFTSAPSRMRNPMVPSVSERVSASPKVV